MRTDICSSNWIYGLAGEQIDNYVAEDNGQFQNTSRTPMARLPQLIK